MVSSGRFCRELASRQHLEFDFRAENVPQELLDEISLCLFRVLQEALQNAAKYSRSRRFQVWLSGGTDQVQLAVRDWEIGFDRVTKGAGLGLTSMKERLRLVNGDLYVDSQPHRGTRAPCSCAL